MNKLCPLAKDICLEDGCAWWDAMNRSCAIVAIAQNASLISRDIETCTDKYAPQRVDWKKGPARAREKP